MIFLKWTMLFGLAGIAVPILIHLLNRSRPRPLKWGAMQFLLASLASQSRRILIEEIILLCLRCLTVALIAMAMAQPFLPSRSLIPWPLVLPAALAAAVCAGIAASLWKDARLRRIMLRAAAVLLLVAGSAMAAERWVQGRWWFSGGSGRDVALVVDGSMSMNMVVEGQTNFRRAVEEAQSVVRACRHGDAVALILAGPVPRAVIARPTADRREVLKKLEQSEFRPLGGAMAVLEAFNAAAAALAQGSNPEKAIVLITDGQKTGWDIQSELRWQFVTDSLKNFKVLPKVFCRRLPLPKTFRNATVADIAFSRTVVGTDRPVKIDVRVINSGTAPVQPTAVELTVDGQEVGRAPIMKELLPQVAEGLHFEHRFESPGRHIVRARVLSDDDLLTDNFSDAVVEVLDRMPVLIVEGTPSERFFRKASGFVGIALAPRRDPRDGAAAAAPEEPVRWLVEPTIMAPGELTAATDFAAYRVVVLANVSRLPAAVSEQLAAFVRKGGGVLVMPGNRAEPDFYNGWKTASGEVLAPAQLKERRAAAEPVHLEPRTFTHPALRLIADPEQSDAGEALVTAWWKLEANPRDTAVRVGGLMQNGDPWLVERQFGRGYIAMTAASLDRRDSNLPSLTCFVPFVHEMIYALAAPLLLSPNVKPGAELTLALKNEKAVDPEALKKAAPDVQVLLPGGGQRPATMATADGRQVIRFGETSEPGVYRMVLPATVAAAAGLPAGAAAEVPFTVLSDPEESSLALLSDADLGSVRSSTGLVAMDTLGELLTAFAGEIPGQELWKILALAALLTIISETLLARWIAVQRRLHVADSINLKQPSQDVAALRQYMEDLVARRGADMARKLTE
jgi:hypothetical protein